MTATAHMLAVAWTELPLQFGHIFYSIVLPMLLLAGVGFLLHRTMRLDLATLTKLNFYFVIPCLIYHAVVSSQVTLADAGAAVAFTLGVMAVLVIIALVAGRLRGIPRDQRNALIMSTIFYNSGNYGLPLQDMAFRSADQSADAASLQSFVMITQNFTGFTIGVMLAAGGKGDRHWRANLLHIAKFPPIYALLAALLTVQIRIWLGESAGHVAPVIDPFWKAITSIKQAFIAVALFTLGAQLASVRRGGPKYPVKMSVFIRLLIGPAVGLAIVHLVGLTGLLAQVMLISTATPTAVNSMLLCMEFDNHPNYLARAVFYSTLLSPITVTLVVFLTLGGYLT